MSGRPPGALGEGASVQESLGAGAGQGGWTQELGRACITHTTRKASSSPNHPSKQQPSGGSEGHMASQV